MMNLNDPVSRCLPAFANLTVLENNTVRPARTVLTLAHLMSMRGGLDYDLQQPATRMLIERTGGKAGTVELASTFAVKPLAFDPGTRYQYSLCHDVVAAVVEVVSGMRFGEYVQKNIFDPLDMKTLTYHPTQEQLDRLAARYSWNGGNGVIEQERLSLPYGFGCPNYESGGAGLLGDVESYVPLAVALANDGVGRTGAQILKPSSINLMRTNQLVDAARGDFTRPGYSYALGVRTMVDPSISRSSFGEFGWDGAAGAYVMIDPAKKVSAFFAMHVLGCEPAYTVYHPAIRDRIFEGVED